MCRNSVILYIDFGQFLALSETHFFLGIYEKKKEEMLPGILRLFVACSLNFPCQSMILFSDYKSMRCFVAFLDFLLHVHSHSFPCQSMILCSD